MSVLTRMKLTIVASALVLGTGAGLAAAQGKVDDNTDRSAARAAFHAERQQRKAAMLQKFNLNKNGVLDPAERQAAGDARAAERFSKLDTDRNGQLSLAEFKAGHQGMGRKGHRGHHGRGHGFGGKGGAGGPGMDDDGI